MAINFSQANVATASEKRNYSRITAVDINYSNDVADAWKSKSPVDFKDGSPKTLSCVSAVPEKSFGCFLKPSDSPRVLIWNSIPFKVVEVRYGDIDKDGDIDIAVKLMNGAIYVFHNLQTSPSKSPTNNPEGWD